MAKRSRVNGLHYWLDVMSRRTVLNKGEHNNIHDAMAFAFVSFHFNGRSKKEQSELLSIISEASKRGGWQAYRVLRRKSGKPLYRGGRGSDITFVSTKPHHKEEHFTREVDRTWGRIDILEREMDISNMKDGNRKSVRWLPRSTVLQLEEMKPEAIDGKIAIENNERDKD